MRTIRELDDDVISSNFEDVLPYKLSFFDICDNIIVLLMLCGVVILHACDATEEPMGALENFDNHFRPVVCLSEN